jgi:hypothetical protein
VDGLEKLVQLLVKRRGRIRALIEDFRRSTRMPFPQWTAGVAVGHA